VYARLNSVSGPLPTGLYVMHIVAVVVHIATLCVCVGVLMRKGGTLPTYRASFDYTPVVNETEGGLFNPRVVIKMLKPVSFAPIVAGFVFPSILEHLFYVVAPGVYNWMLYEDKIGWVRFLSYGLSAPLMNWAVNYLCGIGEPLVLCSSASLIVVMLAIGYVLAPGDGARYKLHGLVATFAMIVAFMPGLLVASSYPDLPAEVPAIITVIAVLYASFGGVFFWSYYSGETAPRYTSEKAYAVLSLTSKVFLAYMLAFGVAMRA